MRIDSRHAASDAKIFILDDDPKNIVPLEAILKRHGFLSCTSMTDPRQAIGRIMELQPDLILLDWHMPTFSGMEVLEELQKHIPEQEMPPVIVLTADRAGEARREGLSAGANDFLTKPLDPSEVLLRIRNLLHMWMLRKREREYNALLEKTVKERTNELRAAVFEAQDTHQQLIRQERIRALGVMAGGIAHDFNNALMVIEGFSDMLLEKPELCGQADRVQESLGAIRTASRDASEIVRRLREFYRPYSKHEEGRSLVDVNSLVEEAVQLSTPKWQTQTRAVGLFVDVEVEPGEMPRIWAVPSELREVLLNLVFNAVDAMPQGGLIKLRTGVEEEMVFVEVEDSGTGMTEETRRHCLEPFYTTKGDRGTGLGLAIIYGIVRRHNGFIRINSEVNRGTQFTVLLPVGSPVETNAEASRTLIPIRPLNILVVDDQREIRQVLAKYLEQDMHVVTTAENGCEALEKFQAGRFDLVLVDRVMPKLSGDQLATAIKAIDPRIPVVVLTAFAEDTSTADVDLLLSKPASLRRIRETVEQIYQTAIAVREPVCVASDVAAVH